MKNVILASILAGASAFCPNSCSGHGTCQTDPKDTCLCFKVKEIDLQWSSTPFDVSTGKNTQPSATSLDLNHYGTTDKTASGARITDAQVAETEEVQTYTVDQTATGNYQLTIGGETTGDIAFDAAAATIQTAVDALSGVSSGDITVTDSGGTGIVVLTFGNNQGNVALATLVETDLVGGTHTAMSETTAGVKGSISAFGLGIDATTRNDGDLTTHTAGMLEGTSSFEGSLSAYSADVVAWTGADCSLRTCPYGMAWAAPPKAKDDHTQRLECSGVGSCDRKTGECKCAAPYTGVGCRRTACQNDCSGHGSCRPQSEIANLASHDAESDISAQFSTPGMSNSQVDSYTGGRYDGGFDAEAQYGCVCDGLYHGPDCSLKSCPSGSDPLKGKGREKGRPCSGRGLCDEESGLCTCASGFYGDYCQSQTTLY